MEKRITAVSRPERILYKKTIAEFSSGRVHYANGDVNCKICRAERTDPFKIFIPRRRYIYTGISKGPIDSLNIYPRYDSLWVAKFWFQKHPRGWASFEP